MDADAGREVCGPVEKLAPVSAAEYRSVAGLRGRAPHCLRPSSSLREQRELRLTLAAQHREIDLDAVDASRLRERAGLGLDHLRGEHAATAFDLDPLQVTRELLDCIDGSDALDLDRDPVALFVAAHEVDRPDVGWPLPPHELQALTEGGGARGELFLEMPLDAVLLQRRRLAHVVRDVTQELGHT